VEPNEIRLGLDMSKGQHSIRAKRQAPDYADGLPAAPDAERWVLGCILTVQLLFDAVRLELSASDFTDPLNRKIWQAMDGLWVANKPIDRLMVAEELKRQNKADGMLGYIAELGEGLPDIIHPENYIYIVRDKAARRRIIQHSDAQAKRAQLETESIDRLKALDVEFWRDIDTENDYHQSDTSDAVVSGPELLERVEQFIRRYVIMPTAAYLAVALWAIATHAVQHFDTFTYLAVVSAAKRSGKTRLAEVLETIVRLPWRGTAPSPAALYRMLEKAPTLLLDEVEVFSGRNKSETTQILVSVLNAGHRRGATIPRCDGPKQEVRYFPVYGAKLLAAIGRLPDTLMDRSIIIHMKRRTTAQKVERFRQARASAEAKPIHDGAARFVQVNHRAIEQAYHHIQDNDLGFLGDRDADLWSALFSICSITDPERLGDLKTCALTLSAAKEKDDVDDSLALTLLRDIREVWPGLKDKCPEDKCETAVLLEKLKALEESPWCDPKSPLTAHKLARLSRPFDVEPRNIQIGERRPKGYLYAQLKDAFDRYLDEKSATHATSQ
jgi:hypothetical protein